MGALPTPYTVGHRVFSSTGRDSHGNPIKTFAPAVDLKVCGIAPGAMAEPDNINRDLSVVLFSLFCPAGTVVGELDRIVMGVDEYDIEGRPKDYTQGPWDNSIAGVVIELKATEG